MHKFTALYTMTLLKHIKSIKYASFYLTPVLSYGDIRDPLFPSFINKWCQTLRTISLWKCLLANISDSTEKERLTNKVIDFTSGAQDLQDAVDGGNFTLWYTNQYHYVNKQQLSGEVICPAGMVQLNFYCGQCVS